MKPDLTPQILAVLRALTPKQVDALRILHISQPTIARSSGIPGGTWKALRNQNLARSGLNEETWFLTELGAAVQKILPEPG